MSYSIVKEFIGVKTELELVQYCVAIKTLAVDELVDERKRAGNKNPFDFDAEDLLPKLEEVLIRKFPASRLTAYSIDDLKKLADDLDECIPRGYEIVLRQVLPAENKQEYTSILTPEGLFEWDGANFNCVLKPAELKETVLSKYYSSDWKWDDIKNTGVSLDAFANDDLFKLDNKTVLNGGHLYSTRQGGAIDNTCVHVTSMLKFIVSEQLCSKKLALIEDKCRRYLDELSSRPAFPLLEKKEKAIQIQRILDECKNNSLAYQRLENVESIILDDKRFKSTLELADSAGELLLKVLHMILNPTLGIKLWKSEFEELKKGLDEDPERGSTLSQ